MHSALRFLVSALREAGVTFRHLAVVMVPVMIVVKILQEAGLIDTLAAPLQPVMAMVGLPASMGLVWATAIVNNIYTAMVVFASLTPFEPVTQAQATVLATMILVAHNLPVELAIAKRAGAGIVFQAIFRLGGAFVLGWILHLVYNSAGYLSQPVQLFWSPESGGRETTLVQWATEQCLGLLAIFGIILVLVVVMRLLEKLRVTERVVGLLQPVLRKIGLGRTAAPLTIVGLIMGIAYGGGMIIREYRSGNVLPRDGFMAVTLLGLTHSVVEDTLLMMAIGAHLSGILWGRILFSLAAVILLAKVLSLISDRLSERLLYHRQKPVKK